MNRSPDQHRRHLLHAERRSLALLSSQRGFTLLELMVVIAVLGIVVAMSIPILADARISSNESAAISHLRTIATAQSFFHQNDADRNALSDYAASLSALHTHGGLIDDALADGTHSGYDYAILPGATPYTWSAVANPDVPGKSGYKYFFIDESSVIRFSTSHQAGPTDTPIGN